MFSNNGTEISQGRNGFVQLGETPPSVIARLLTGKTTLTQNIWNPALIAVGALRQCSCRFVGTLKTAALVNLCRSRNRLDRFVSTRL
jgi:hypothetical protein